MRLYPKKPYDFHLSAMIFSRGDPQIRTYKEGIFRQVLNIQEIAVLVDVFSKGTADIPELYFTVHPEDVLAKSGNAAVRNLISSMFNIHEDLAPFYRAVEKDGILTFLISQLRGVKSPTTPTVFEALVDSIIEQQISLTAAHSVETRLVRAFGTPSRT
jgi:DNA-3-methyladenine glycosylase II